MRRHHRQIVTHSRESVLIMNPSDIIGGTLKASPFKMTPEQRTRWKRPPLSREEAGARRDAKRTPAERAIVSRCRLLTVLRVSHALDVRAGRVDSRRSMAFDVEHLRIQSEIATRLDAATHIDGYDVVGRAVRQVA